MKSETNKRSRGALLSRREASVSSLLWLGLRSPCQHMSWPRVLTAALRGFHQASRNLPTVQTTAMLIVHCAVAFLQSASRILCSLALHSILKVSYDLLCQVKPVPRTCTEYISLCRSNLQMLSKNKIVDLIDMRSFTKLIPGAFLASQTPATLHDCYSGVGPQATRFCSLYYMCCQANCLPCTLWVWMGVQHWSSPLQALSRNTHPAKLKLATTSHHAAHRSTYAPVQEQLVQQIINNKLSFDLDVSTFEKAFHISS